jgi:hypothetical protein
MTGEERRGQERRREERIGQRRREDDRTHDRTGGGGGDRAGEERTHATWHAKQSTYDGGQHGTGDALRRAETDDSDGLCGVGSRAVKPLPHRMRTHTDIRSADHGTALHKRAKKPTTNRGVRETSPRAAATHDTSRTITIHDGRERGNSSPNAELEMVARVGQSRCGHRNRVVVNDERRRATAAYRHTQRTENDALHMTTRETRNCSRRYAFQHFCSVVDWRQREDSMRCSSVNGQRQRRRTSQQQRQLSRDYRGAQRRTTAGSGYSGDGIMADIGLSSSINSDGLFTTAGTPSCCDSRCPQNE